MPPEHIIASRRIIVVKGIVIIMYEMSFAEIIIIALNRKPNIMHFNDAVLPFLKPFMNVNGPKIRIISKIKRTISLIISYGMVFDKIKIGTISAAKIGVIYSEYAGFISVRSTIARGLLMNTKPYCDSSFLFNLIQPVVRTPRDV